MKILIYGFKPYRQWKENISEKIINKIPKRQGFKKVVFPAKFDRKQFIREVKGYEPDIILGLGQHPRGKKIRIERKAVNFKARSKRERPKPILKNKPQYQFVNLRLKPSKNSWISYYAGKYVCNFSMYIIADFIRDKDIKFAFIHLPRGYNLNAALKYIEKMLKAL